MEKEAKETLPNNEYNQDITTKNGRRSSRVSRSNNGVSNVS